MLSLNKQKPKTTIQKRYGLVLLVIIGVLSLSLRDSMEIVHSLLHKIPNPIHFHEAHEEHDLMDHAGDDDHDSPSHKSEKNTFKSFFKLYCNIEAGFIFSRPNSQIATQQYGLLQINGLRSCELPSVYSPPELAS